MSDYFFGITDPGKIRDNNEDAYLVVPLRAGRVLTAVIDGVGGYEGGEVAAAIARDCISELADSPLENVTAALRATVVEVNHRIIEARKTQQGKEQMACVLTLALADTEANEFHHAHVGDTRLYLLRGLSLIKVSKDHSFVGFLEESNRITEMDAMKHPKRNEVNKVLGVDPNIGAQPDYIDTGQSPFLPGDLLLLCSDGLTDMISSQKIINILTGGNSIGDKAAALIDAANNAGGKDNVTVVLVQHPKAPQHHEPTLPVSKKKNEEPLVEVEPAEQIVRRTNPLAWILAIVCLGLGGVIAWQYFQGRSKPTKETQIVKEQSATPQRQRNPAEQQLIEKLAQSSDSLILDSALASNPILLSDSLLLDKYSFQLSGNGLVLRGDSAMRGPALHLPATMTFLLLENIVFENFQTAIVANSTVLKMRNVRFKNCGTSVQYAFHFPDTVAVSGLIHEGFFFKTDSIPKRQ